MRVTRRNALGMGGGLLAALFRPPAGTAAQDAVSISMTGRRDGSRVWFDPIGIRIRAGQTVRWTNRDVANSHTATAYHSAKFSRPLRIPRDSEPWDSGYLMPGESFQTMLTVPGVYDYYCIPHEMAGMVGRIVVGEPSPDWMARLSDDELPEAALRAFPPVEEIMMQGVVRRS